MPCSWALWKTEPGAKLQCFSLDTIPGQSDEGKWRQGRIEEKQSVRETWLFAPSREIFLAGHEEHSHPKAVPQREEGRFFICWLLSSLVSELKFVSQSVNSLILTGCITWPLLAAAGEAKLDGTPSIDYVGSRRSRPSVLQRVGHGCWSCTMDALLVPKFTPGAVKTATSSRG